MTGPLPYRTERLTFREMVEADRETVFAYRVIPEVSRYLGLDGTDPEQLNRWWETRLRGIADGSVFHTVVELRGRIIGDAWFRLSDAPSVNGPTGEREGNLGYAFDPAYAGQGYASETCRALQHLGFDGLGLRRITTEVFGGHAVSSHILAKHGFRHEGTSVQKVWNREGFWFDDEHWAMLRDEWRSLTR